MTSPASERLNTRDSMPLHAIVAPHKFDAVREWFHHEELFTDKVRAS